MQQKTQHKSRRLFSKILLFLILFGAVATAFSLSSSRIG